MIKILELFGGIGSPRVALRNLGIPGKLNGALYKQAGNSIAVPIFESIFRKILLGETTNNVEKQMDIFDFT